MRFVAAIIVLGILIEGAALATTGTALPIPPGFAQPAPAAATATATSTGSKQPPLRINWRTDLSAAQGEAAATGRLVFLYFTADWCQPCHLMENTTFVSRGVAQCLLEKFIPVRVDDTKETSPISTRFAIRVYPSMLFLESDGTPLHMELGPRPASQLLPLLEKVAAIPGLMAAVKKSPEDAQTHYALGLALTSLEHQKRAEPYLKRVIELDPKIEKGLLVKARLLLCFVPLEDGEAAKAIQNLDAFVEEFKDLPEVPSAIFYKGAILMQDKRLEEAREIFDELRKRFPKHEKAYEADKAIDLIDACMKAEAAAAAASSTAPQPAPPAPTSSPTNPSGT